MDTAPVSLSCPPTPNPIPSVPWLYPPFHRLAPAAAVARARASIVDMDAVMQSLASWRQARTASEVDLDARLGLDEGAGGAGGEVWALFVGYC